MKLRAHLWAGAALAVAITALPSQQLAAQTTMPSTLRHGSGYLDNPVASVLPHMSLQATVSSFWMSVNPSLVTDATGATTGFGPEVEQFNADASVTIGLLDRMEVGASLLSMNDASAGGNLYSFFGRVALAEPAASGGFGFAVGARYNNSPDYPGTGAEPNRLGYPDRRFTRVINGAPNTNMSAYAVGSLFLRGLEADWMPENDVTFSAGYGTGLFQDGGGNDFYSNADTNGWFAATSMAMAIGEKTALHLISEWNGFDMNFGAQVDLSGVRIGAHLLGANHASNVSTYRSRKLGLLASVGLCGGGLCEPKLSDRPEPEVIQLPAPAPDTVIVTREVEAATPSGTPQTICLATGQDVRVLMTAQGDTLVGDDAVSIRTLRPGVVFAGTYADGRDWYTNDEDVRYENRNYSKSGNPVSLQCSSIMRVGEHMGVPVFANRSAERPFETLYVPVRPGAWQAYETLRGTRGW